MSATGTVCPRSGSSPDLNPIERVWLLMKTEWFEDFFAKNEHDLIDRLCEALNWITNRKLNNQITWAIRKEL
jgi:transposase